MKCTKENYEKVKSQVKSDTPDIIIEQIACQLDRVDEAATKIKNEGTVVRGLNGAVIQHPAIKIESDATKMVTDLMQKHKKRKINT